jgi:phenylacetate-CoA ligase
MKMYPWLLNNCGLPLVSVFTGSRFFSLYSSFVNHPERLFCPAPQKRLADLRSLLQHCYETVPFYRERFDAIGFLPKDLNDLNDLQRLPTLQKGEIEKNFPDRILSSRRSLTPWRYRSTTGTIERLTVVHDSRKRDLARALQLFSLYSTSGYIPGMKYMEIPPDVCRNVCGQAETIESISLRSVLKNWSAPYEAISDLRGLVERQCVYRQKLLPSLSAIGMQRTREIDDCLKAIDEYQPAVLKALPAYLYVLAVHILDRRLKAPRIGRCISPMGASMSPSMKRVVERAFDCRVHEDYGSAELTSIATECRHQNAMHPFAAFFHIEVVCGSRSANPGEMGRILITDLSNYAMPLVRYEIGDVGRFNESSCPCGIGGPRLDVYGRLKDCLQTGDGSLISQDEIVDTLLADPAVLLFQLEQRSTAEAFLEVVPRHSHTPDLEATQRKVERLLGGNSRVRARLVPYIQPEPGGKYRFVKNLLPQSVGALGAAC